MRQARNRRNYGFTLVEMITVVAVFGLILTLLGLEFVSVVDHTLHTRASTDAESQARIIMSKVETHLRTAYFDYTDFPSATATPAVASPLPASSATPAAFVTFYRVTPGSMATTPPTCAPSSPLKGALCPPFDLVTIQINPLIPGELDEIVTQLPSGVVEPTIVLGTNVSNFGVTPVSSNRYDLSLTVTEPSTHCSGDACSFTLNDIVYVGGQD